MLTPYATGKTVVPGAVRTLGAMDLEPTTSTRRTRASRTCCRRARSRTRRCISSAWSRSGARTRNGAMRYYSRVDGRRLRRSPRSSAWRASRPKQSGVDAGLAHLEEFGRTQPQLGPRVVVGAGAALLSSLERRQARAARCSTPASRSIRRCSTCAWPACSPYERPARATPAVRELRALLAERPGDAVVQNALGYTLADQDRDLGEAQQLLTAALAQSPDSAADAGQHGMAAATGRGKYPEALEYLQRAHELGDDPEIDLHVGEVQWAMGDQAAARKTWQEALAQHPEQRGAREADRARREVMRRSRRAAGLAALGGCAAAPRGADRRRAGGSVRVRVLDRTRPAGARRERRGWQRIVQLGAARRRDDAVGARPARRRRAADRHGRRPCQRHRRQRVAASTASRRRACCARASARTCRWSDTALLDARRAGAGRPGRRSAQTARAPLRVIEQADWRSATTVQGRRTACRCRRA